MLTRSFRPVAAATRSMVGTVSGSQNLQHHGVTQQHHYEAAVPGEKLQEFINSRPLTAEEEEIEEAHQIAAKAMELVPEVGFGLELIPAALSAQGIPQSWVGRFPKGPVHVAWAFCEESNRKLKHELAHKNLAGMGVRARVATGLKTRLQMTADYRGRWAAGIALMSRPDNILESGRLLKDTADEIWFAAGDRSVDYNWYSKRALVSAVYAATEVRMLSDPTADLQPTWEFMDRRLTDAMKLGGKAGGAVKGVIGFGDTVQNLLALAKSGAALHGAATQSGVLPASPQHHAGHHAGFQSPQQHQVSFQNSQNQPLHLQRPSSFGS